MDVARPWLRTVPPSAVAPRRHHAWVQLSGQQEPAPALVLRWVKGTEGWSAWVVVADDEGRAVLIQAPAAQLRPA